MLFLESGHSSAKLARRYIFGELTVVDRIYVMHTAGTSGTMISTRAHIVSARPYLSPDIARFPARLR